MNRETHETRLLKWFETHDTITQLEATTELGNTRLGATVFNLREKGYNIITEPTKGKNRWGQTSNYGTYRMVK